MMKRALATALVLSSALAHAHGGLPVSQTILRQANGDTMYVPVVFWGVWVGPAGGPWKWICEEMINGYRFRKFALSSDGTFYTTDTKGLTRSTDHGCTWTAVSGTIASLHIADVVADPVDGATAYAASGDGGTVLPDGGIVPAVNGVFVTHDHGDTWTALAGLSAQSGSIFQTVRVAPSDAMTLYATSAQQMTPFTPSLHHSSDGGATFTTTPLSYLLDGVAPHALELLAVDPRNPAVVWARAVAEVPMGSTSIERHALLRSTDAGVTWTEEYKLDATQEASGATRGIDSVAFDVAANKVYVATRTGLLAGSDDGSATAPTLAPTGNLSQAQCVDVHGGAVYACSSQFPPDNAAIARSTDGAQTFSSVLNYADTVGPVDSCPKGTPVADNCPSYWYQYGAQLGITFDAGVDMTGTMPKSGGCSCSIGAVGGAAGGALFALVLLAIAVRALTRRSSEEA